MNLTYFKNLSDEEIVELINACIQYESDILKLKVGKPNISQFKVYAEDDRVDINNQRYALIYANSQAYMITDYTLKTYDSVVCPEIDFSNILHLFMTKRFGEEYINSLYEVKLQELETKRDELRNTLREDKRGLVREKQNYLERDTFI